MAAVEMVKVEREAGAGWRMETAGNAGKEIP